MSTLAREGERLGVRGGGGCIGAFRLSMCVVSLRLDVFLFDETQALSDAAVQRVVDGEVR